VNHYNSAVILKRSRKKYLLTRQHNIPKFNTEIHESTTVTYLWVISLVLLYLLDGYDKYNRINDGVKHALYFRGVIQCLMLIYIIRLYSIHDKIVQLGFLLIISYIVGFVLVGSKMDHSFISAGYFFVRYIYFLFAIVVSSHVKGLLLVGRTFFILFVFNCLLAWYGLLFDVQLFSSYGHLSPSMKLRFGYDGLIPEQNIATYFYLSGLIISYWLYVKEHISLFVVVFGVVSCMIVGTKMLVISTIALVSCVLVKNGYKKQLITFFVIVLCTITSSSHWHAYFANRHLFDLPGSLNSGRVYLIKTKLLPLISKLSLNGWFFGVQNPDPMRYLIEMELIDLLIFFGLLGTTVYLLIIYLIATKIRKAPCGIEVLIVFIITAFLSGHFFYDPAVAVYFSSVLIMSQSIQTAEFNHAHREMRDQS